MPDAFNQARLFPDMVARHGIVPGSPARAVFACWGGLYRVHGFSGQHTTVEFTSPILHCVKDFACGLPLRLRSGSRAQNSSTWWTADEPSETVQSMGENAITADVVNELSA